MAYDVNYCILSLSDVEDMHNDYLSFVGSFRCFNAIMIFFNNNYVVANKMELI